MLHTHTHAREKCFAIISNDGIQVFVHFYVEIYGPFKVLFAVFSFALSSFIFMFKCCLLARLPWFGSLLSHHKPIHYEHQSTSSQNFCFQLETKEKEARQARRIHIEIELHQHHHQLSLLVACCVYCCGGLLACLPACLLGCLLSCDPKDEVLSLI